MAWRDEAREKSSRGRRLIASRPARISPVDFLELLESRLLLSSSPVKPAAPTSRPTFVIFHGATSSAQPFVGSGPTGTSPTTMRNAYGFNQVTFGSTVGDGTGQTIAIIDAFNDPDIVSNLHTFDAQFGLANPTFTIVNQNGGTSLPSNAPNPGNSWAVETSLDVEWAHVVAPGAKILLVEASSATDSSLFAAVNTARNTPGVSAVSMSWGGDEFNGQSFYDQYLTTPANHNGVTFIASAGDSGAFSRNTTNFAVGYPAISPDVVGVGGTALHTNSGSYSSESTWGSGMSSGFSGGGGGGISQFYSQPSYQNGVVTQSASQRTIPDVSLDADPNTGVPIYDSYDISGGWVQVGGTSLAAPMWAGVIAIANQGRVLEGEGTLDGPSQTLPKLYSLPASDFHDITSGNNGYPAGPGYDLATGLGTPIVNNLVPDLVGISPQIGSIGVSQTAVESGTTVTLTAGNVTESQGTVVDVEFFLEANAAAGPSLANDSLLGDGTQNGTSWTIDASTAGLAAGNYAFYAIAIDALNVPSAPAPVALTVVAPTIGNFSVAPSSVQAGSSILLTAANVAELNGNVSSVTFYQESNGSAGLQPATDTPIGVGQQNGTTWMLSTTAPTQAGGNYTYYAVATDTANITGAASTAQLTVVTPTIGSFSVSPSPVQAGAGITLTASNVVETNGNVSGVTFYLETNGNAGLQTATDTPIGAGVQNGTTWTLATNAPTLAGGTYTYYAVPTDTVNISGAASSAQLTIVTPTIGSFSVSPSTVHAGASITFTASNVVETNGTVGGVSIYRESDGTAGLQIATDLPVGSATRNGTTWTLTTTAAVPAGGTYTYYAVATDTANISSPSSSATLTIVTPTIGTFTVSPTAVASAASFKLTASRVAETNGTVTGVSFYRESDATSGLQPAVDTFVGSGTQSSTTWTFTASATGLMGGNYTYYAVATDTGNISSVAASATLKIVTPTIGSFTVSPTAVQSGASIKLTASNVTESGGTVASVIFYRDSNASPGLQPAFDTVVGSGTRSGSAWTLTTTAAGLTGGAYTYYAVATDTANVSSAASLATLKIVTPTIGSFTINPTSVKSGTNVTLTANSVTESSGTVSSVAFYLESNGVSGLETAGDTLIGAGKHSGSTWTISLSTTGMAAGSYTLYAVATDSANISSAVASKILTIT